MTSVNTLFQARNPIIQLYNRVSVTNRDYILIAKTRPKKNTWTSRFIMSTIIHMMLASALILFSLRQLLLTTDRNN
jgi:hypothetical protein